MKIVKDNGEELDLDEKTFKYFVIGAEDLLTQGLIHKFLEDQGIPAQASVVPLTKEYCKLGKFFNDIDKDSYDIIGNILESDTPYKTFTETYKDIKIVKFKVLNDWKDLIDKELSQESVQELMFS